MPSFDAVAAVASWSAAGPGGDCDLGGLLGQVRSSSERLLRNASGLTDDRLLEPSQLDGWTRGHVLTHVARSADAYARLLDLARTGVDPGNGADPDGHGHAASDHVADLDASLTRLFTRAAAMPAPAWQALVTARAGWRHPAWFTLLRGWRELETHHVDLDVGYEPADWPVTYVVWALEETFTTLAERGFPLAHAEATDVRRVWKLSAGNLVVCAPAHVLLGWLAGRTPAPVPRLPDPPVWPLPPVPGWGRADEA